MADSGFTLRRLKKEFGLQVDEQPDLFAVTLPIPCSDYLAKTLEETV